MIDAQGPASRPGLIDSHVHPVFGDWTPRQNQLGWIDSTLNGGVTTMISAGEVHLPGRPKDIVGLKALAITAQRAFDNFRPGGVKVLAGAPVIEKGMVEQRLQGAGRGRRRPAGRDRPGLGQGRRRGATMVAWARKHGIQSTIHTGGPSIPGSGLIDKDVVLEADADIIGHINGGHTALPEAHVCELCEGRRARSRSCTTATSGSPSPPRKTALQLKCPHRVILGTDGPAGSGVQPLGILRMIALLSSLANIPAELVFCFATGNTARIRKLNCGLVEVGRAADFVFMDRAQHTAGRTLLESVQLGDIPGVGMVMIDGIVRCGRSRNTPPATEIPVVVLARTERCEL